MRILYVTTVGLTMRFFKSIIRELIDLGNVVDIATNESEFEVDDCYREWGCNIYPIDCSRSPLKISNLKAIKQIKKIVTDGKYDIVHCHTPIAAACTRFACIKARKKGTRVFYTAHGFHFYKGAPIKNWLLFYPIEKICSYFTDVLITINKEDYALAKRKLKAQKIEYIPGVGVNAQKINDIVIGKHAKRAELGIPDESFVILSVGELNENKNHKIIIDTIDLLKSRDVHYCIVGQGHLKEYLLSYIDNKNLKNNVHLFGYRQDVFEFYKMSDLYVLPSVREGLNVSVIEAMTMGLPCVLSKIRGNTDLIKHNEGGFLCETVNDYLSAINKIKNNLKMRNEFSQINKKKSCLYEQSNINKRIVELYFGV